MLSCWQFTSDFSKTTLPVVAGAHRKIMKAGPPTMGQRAWLMELHDDRRIRLHGVPTIGTNPLVHNPGRRWGSGRSSGRPGPIAGSITGGQSIQLSLPSGSEPSEQFAAPSINLQSTGPGQWTACVVLPVGRSYYKPFYRSGLDRAQVITLLDAYVADPEATLAFYFGYRLVAVLPEMEELTEGDLNL